MSGFGGMLQGLMGGLGGAGGAAGMGAAAGSYPAGAYSVAPGQQGPVLQAGAQAAGGAGGGRFMQGLGKAATMMNPNAGSMSPQQQQAAGMQGLLGAIGNMNLSGGAGQRGQRRGMDFGLGQLNSVVEEAYKRSQDQKAETQWEREQQRKEAADKAAREEAQRLHDLQIKEEERRTKQLEASLKAQEAQQRIAQGNYDINRQTFEQQMKDRQRLAELTAKLRTGQLTPGEQAEYHALGGSITAVDPSRRFAPSSNMWDLYNTGGLGGGPRMPSPDDIWRAGQPR